MSLYHEAVAVLQAAEKEKTSLKTQVFSKKGWKSDLKTLYALTAESAKWSSILSDVIANSRILQAEKQLSPSLALVLTHDLLLAKKGIALPAKHGLHAALARNKSRLNSELTKVRLKRGCANLEDLRKLVDEAGFSEIEAGETKQNSIRHIRWVRVNAIKSSVKDQLASTFSGFQQLDSLSDFARLCSEKGKNAKAIHQDQHVLNLLAIPAAFDILSTKAYKTGELILQDKASCFPAYLLDPASFEGDIMDTCAAPGNKTTHIAAILHEHAATAENDRHVIACEKDMRRSETLKKMVRVAGGNKIISIKAQQDVMKLKPGAKEFASVTALLLDPSCSGSGIVNRDDLKVSFQLPSKEAPTPVPSKKRKRGKASTATNTSESAQSVTTITAEQEIENDDEEETPLETSDEAKLQERLDALSSFQLRLVQRAMEFPAAKRITYSTCSIHAAENEHVVVKALQSDVAKRRGWKVLLREEQIEGMRKWHRRGWVSACSEALDTIRSVGGEMQTKEEIAEACIRCEKGTDDYTMGFFVAAFVRTGEIDIAAEPYIARGIEDTKGEDDVGESSESGDDEEWNGFDE